HLLERRSEIPLVEAALPAPLQPGQRPVLGLLPVPSTGPAATGKRSIRVELAGQDRTGVQEDRVAFRIVAHGVTPGAIRPACEVEDTGLQRTVELAREAGIISVAVQHPQQAGHGGRAALGPFTDPAGSLFD